MAGSRQGTEARSRQQWQLTWAEHALSSRHCPCVPLVTPAPALGPGGRAPHSPGEGPRLTQRGRGRASCWARGSGLVTPARAAEEVGCRRGPQHALGPLPAALASQCRTHPVPADGLGTPVTLLQTLGGPHSPSSVLRRLVPCENQSSRPRLGMKPLSPAPAGASGCGLWRERGALGLSPPRRAPCLSAC